MIVAEVTFAETDRRVTMYFDDKMPPRIGECVSVDNNPYRITEIYYNFNGQYLGRENHLYNLDLRHPLGLVIKKA